jgi:hypothetical protein
MEEFNKLHIRGFVGTMDKTGTISVPVGQTNQGRRFVLGVGYDSPISKKDTPEGMEGRRLSERKVDWFNCTSWEESIVEAFEKDSFAKADQIEAVGYIRFRKDPKTEKLFTNVTITRLEKISDQAGVLAGMS